MHEEVKICLDYLKNGHTIIYPTDTVWGIGCDATDENAVKKVYNIKRRDESKSLVILVNSVEMLKEYIQEIPEKVHALLQQFSRPTSIIYNNPIGLAKNVIAHDNTVAIRIVQNDFCKELIKQFGRPVVSTSANISGNSTPKSFQEIEKSVLEAVDYVVNLQRDLINDSPSRIIKIDEKGELIVIRD